MMRRAVRWLMRLAAVLLVLVAGYLGAAFIGAHVPSTQTARPEQRPTAAARKVYLLTSPLHADIAIRATPGLLQRFAFLQASQVPVDHPGLQYLAFGWGSRAFYTSAGDHSDISVSAAFKAITGDGSVMRVVGWGDVTGLPDNIEIELTKEGYDRLLSAIERGFSRDDAGEQVLLPDASIGANDAFFESDYHFNIFYPCNQWVRDALLHVAVP